VIRFQFMVEFDFPRRQDVVFAFIEDPQSMIEAGLATSVTGSVGRRAKGTIVSNGTTTTFRVRRYNPPNRTIIDHLSQPDWLTVIQPAARVAIREENLYLPTLSGCRLVRGLRVEMINVHTKREGAGEEFRQLYLKTANDGLEQLLVALLRRVPPTSMAHPGEGAQPPTDLPANDPYLNG
jgi:hypothetical protein